MGAMTRVENDQTLGRLAGPVHAAVAKLIEKRAGVRGLLSGRALGHPAHPAVVLLPMSGWLSATWLDLVGGARSRDAAQALRLAGLVTAAPSVATGASDWLDTTGAEQRTGLLHAATNVTAFGLFASSMVLHHRGAHRSGALASVMGAATAGVGGFLGGHLAYRLGVGVDTTAFDGGPTEWTAISADPSEGSMVATEADGIPLVAARVDGRLRVLADRCTHRGGPLHEGTLADGCITCPWHGSTFDVHTGAVVAGPAVAPQPAYEVRQHAGTQEVRRDEPSSLRTNPVRAGSRTAPTGDHAGDE